MVDVGPLLDQWYVSNRCLALICFGPAQLDEQQPRSTQARLSDEAIRVFDSLVGARGELEGPGIRWELCNACTDVFFAEPCSDGFFVDDEMLKLKLGGLGLGLGLGFGHLPSRYWSRVLSVASVRSYTARGAVQTETGGRQLGWLVFDHILALRDLLAQQLEKREREKQEAAERERLLTRWIGVT